MLSDSVKKQWLQMISSWLTGWLTGWLSAGQMQYCAGLVLLVHPGCGLLEKQVPLSSSVCVLIADVSDPEQTRHLPPQPGLLLGKWKGQEDDDRGVEKSKGQANVSWGNEKRQKEAQSKWKHFTLMLQTGMAGTYHTPLLPQTANTLTMLCFSMNSGYISRLYLALDRLVIQPAGWALFSDGLLQSFNKTLPEAL